MSVERIYASGFDVAIQSDDGNIERISRKEALLRAQRIVGLDQQAEQWVEALLKAANQARINELGKPYSSANMELLLKTASDHTRQIKGASRAAKTAAKRAR